MLKYVFLLMLVLLNGCSSGNVVLVNSNSDKFILDVEIADDSIERSKGLMFRENLCEDCGMLFVYDDSRIRSFWMKNTLIPLDMIFVDEDFKILNIENAVPCKENPCFLYKSDGRAKYVLEVNGGFSSRNNINIGDKMAIMYDQGKSSEIRKIQRAGRVARLEKGKIITLLTKDTREIGYFWASKRKEIRMKNILIKMQTETQEKLVT